MDRSVRLRKFVNVTVLDQSGVEMNKLLVVLFGNPFINAMKPKK